MKIGHWYRLLATLAIAMSAQAGVGSAIAKPEAPVEKSLGADQMIAGCPVSVTQSIAGDAILAGCHIEVLGEVAGDVVAAGGTLEMAAPVHQGIYAFGGRLFIDSVVQRNVRVAGGRVELGPHAKVGGNVSAAGGRIDIEGAVTGYVQAGGGRVRINGPIGGDVEVGSGELELGPKAIIDGKLRYASGKEIERDPAAQVLGGIERYEHSEDASATRHWMRGARYSMGWLWTFGLLVVAAVLLLALPERSAAIAHTARTRFGASILVGFIALVCIPVATLIAFITVIGIPLGLAAIALYFALVLAGYVAAGIALGDVGLQRWGGARAGSRGWRIGAVVLALVLLAVVGRIPFLGHLIGFIALLTGMGAVLLQLRQSPTAAGNASTASAPS